MRERVTWDRVADPAGIAGLVHPGWVQRALTAEDWRGFPGNEPGGGDGVSKVERIAQQIFDKLAELHLTYVHEPARCNEFALPTKYCHWDRRPASICAQRSAVPLWMLGSTRSS